MSWKTRGLVSCLVLATMACGGGTENRLEFDVTDCANIHDGEVWSWPMIGSEHRAFGIPDTNVSYWFATLPVLDEELYPGAHLQLRGQFPDARFFSFQNSDDERSFVDWIEDHMIHADPGSVHPFRDGIPYPTGGEPVNYTVRVRDVPPGQRVHTPDENTLFGGYDPATGRRAEENHIVYRVYGPRGVPAHPGVGDGVTGGVGPARVVYVVDLDRAGPETLTTKEAICALFPQRNRLAGRLSERFFRRMNSESAARAPGLAENPNIPDDRFIPPERIEFVILDHGVDVLKPVLKSIPEDWGSSPGEPLGGFVNRSVRYLVAFLDPAKEDEPLTVIRFKAPTSPPGAIYPEAGQVRYWSLCVQQTLNYAYTWACASDRQLVADPGAPGWFTVVFSSPADRPAGLCDPVDPASSDPDPEACVHNWMHYGSPVPWVFFRHVAPSRAQFPESTRFYEGDPLDAEAIRDHMGEYYPRGATCGLEGFELNLCGLGAP